MNTQIINTNLNESDLLYETDEEYLHLIHKIFCITPVAKTQDVSLQGKMDDDDVNDDDDLSADIIHQFLDHVIEFTISKEYWKKLYLQAAATFLSEDAEVGLPVLLSYSYLPKFYKLLQMDVGGLHESAAFIELYDSLFAEFTKK
jgi:hypothetical protein